MRFSASVTPKITEESLELLKALVIAPNEKTLEFGSLLAVARAEARKREHSERNPPILALKFVPELGVFVAVYEATENANSDQMQCKVN